MASTVNVASGEGWPNLDEGEVLVVLGCVVGIIGLLWWCGYKIWQLVEADRYRANRIREKQRQADEAERADRERMLQMRAEGWPEGVESLPVEQIREIVKQSTAVHYKVAAAVTRGQGR